MENGSTICLITGASRGIGKAIALCLPKFLKDCIIVFTYKNDLESAKKVIGALNANNIQGEMLKCDLNNKDDINNIFNLIKCKYNKLDVLINNVGITADGSFVQAEETEIRGIIDVNFYGTMLCSYLALPLLIESKGTIVMVSSISAYKGKEGQTLYSATKGAVQGLIRILARKYGPLGIRINGVAPGFINTDMVGVLDSGLYKHILNATTLKRMGEPDEVAQVVSFLASPLSSYINGSIIPIDGGLQK
jgi:3-oxoacyl-[acyl-carrier protein] reductase